MRLTPSRAKFLLNIWGPFRGAGIWVQSVAPDWREMTVSMGAHFYNQNVIGTHFGGSLFAMADPLHVVMLMNILGRDYVVWDKDARIEFLKPGRGKLRARGVIDDEVLDGIRSTAETGTACYPRFVVDIVDEEEQVVARIHKTLYIRRKRTADGSERHALEKSAPAL
jgi:acyl-coenzyme A thioesterase PaaI-like protein